MEFLEFCNLIKLELDKKIQDDDFLHHKKISEFFVSQLDDLICNSSDENLKMTSLSILFEGFYRHITDDHYKKQFIAIRAQRWANHFGVPTIPFLLTYQTRINKTFQFFVDCCASNIRYWLVRHESGFILDHNNNVIIDPTSISRIVAPPSEITGEFTKTYNSVGGFTTTPCDPISQQFIQDAANINGNQCRVLEIGGAFGAATLQAIAQGAEVFCNDINPENLAVVRNRLDNFDSTDSITGDDNKLVLIPGEFPNELTSLPKKYFDAILICRVLHFFTGEKIEESLRLVSQLLIPGGKIYIVCETPFLKNWQKFIPEFNSRIEKGIEWPGEIVNPADFESSGRAASLPKFVHWITKEILERSLSRTNFLVKHSMYINRKGQFPDDLLLPEYGKESVGVIGFNQGNK